MATRNNEALLDAAIDRGLLSRPELSRLRNDARRRRIDLIDLVTQEGRFPRKALYQALAAERSLAFMSLEQLRPAQDLMRRLPASLLHRKGLLPLYLESGEVAVVTSDPDDALTLASVSRILGTEVAVVVAESAAIQMALRDAGSFSDRASALQLEAEPDFDPVEELDRLFGEAWLLRASDIHVEPGPETPRVRLRVDGRLQVYPVELSLLEAAAIVSRVKVLADLDIAEQREPQDGGLTYSLTSPLEKDLDLRIATLPTRWGERLTIRILGQETEALTLGSIGMNDRTLERFDEAIKNPHGLVLLTGPTGSGKSTTLYAALRKISQPDINILTVEDPVEYLLQDISQVQVSGKVDFAGALRSFLRHDPDVLMVGEIRDGETADVALKAAMTGHLVFSTLHTNDAPSAVTRLVDIGAERFLLSATLLGVIAQRLVRRLCAQCSRARLAHPEEREWLGVEEEDVEVRDPVGCPLCLGTGYRGRVGLFETLWIDETIASLIHEGASEATIREQATDFQTLYDDSCQKVLTGITSPAEVRRVVSAPARSE